MQHSVRHPSIQPWVHQRVQIRRILPRGLTRCLSKHQVNAKQHAAHGHDPQQQRVFSQYSPAAQPPVDALTMPIVSCARLLLLAGAVTAAMLFERRPAMAAVGAPLVHTIADSKTSSAAAPRGVWRSLKSATGAPLQALDRLMFPDEPIALVRTSADSGRVLGSSARRTQSTEAASSSPDICTGTATTAVEAASSLHLNGAAASMQGAAAADVRLAPITLAQLSALASACGTKLTAAFAPCAAALPAPSWLAGSCAFTGLSHAAGAGASRTAPAATSAATAEQLRVWGYIVSCLLMAVVAWHLAASIPAGNQTANPAARRTSSSGTSAATPPPPISEGSGMLTDPDGSSCAAGPLASAQPGPVVLSTPAPVPESLMGKQVVGPYCLVQDREVQESAAEPDNAGLVSNLSDRVPSSPLEKGPFVPSYVNSAPAISAEHEPTVLADAVPGQDQLLLELGGKQSVGPYYNEMQQPAATHAARAATSRALGVQLAALREAANAAAVDDELSCVMTADVAATNAAAVVEAALAAAAAAEQGGPPAEDQVALSEGPYASEDNQPLFRVQSAAPAAEPGPFVSLEGTLAAEAVREALVAESAAAAATVAAERAHAAAHLIEQAASAYGAVAAHTAAEAAMAAAAAAEVAAAVLNGASELAEDAVNVPADMIAQLAAEAKAAEAAAAMATMRQIVLRKQDLPARTAASKLAPTGATESSNQRVQAGITAVATMQAAPAQLSGTEAASPVVAAGPVDEMSAVDVQSLIAEALAAEAAAMPAQVAKDELIAEAIAAEAAAVAGQAAAEATRAAAAAGGSAGDAAEAVRPPVQGGAQAQQTQSASTSTTQEVQKIATVCGVLDTGASVDQQLAALTALAAASGHPAILNTSIPPSSSSTSSREEPVPTGTAATLSSAALDSTDAAAFKDEFPVLAADEQGSAAAATTTTTVPSNRVVARPAKAGSSIALAAALDAASQHQMQQASATAVMLAQTQFSKLYRARRIARAAHKPGTTGSAAMNEHTFNSTDSLQKVVEAYNYLGVDDAALALALADLDAGVAAIAADKEQDAGTTEETEANPISDHFSHSRNAVAETALPLSPSTAKPAVSESAKVEASVQPGSFTVPVTVLSGGSNSSSSRDPYVALAEALSSDSSHSDKSCKREGSGSSDSFEVPVQIEGDELPGERSDAEGFTSSSFKDFGRSASKAKGVRRSNTGSKQTCADMRDTTGGSLSIPIEWISTPSASKRIQLKQRAAAVLGAGQGGQHQAAAKEQPSTASEVTSAGCHELSSVAAQLSDVQPELAELAAAAVAPLHHVRNYTTDTDMAAAYGMPKPLMDGKAEACIDSSSSLPPGWGSAAASKGSASTALAAGSWSAVSAQLAAELDTELADLVASAAARLDQDMQAAYSTPEVRLPASATPTNSIEVAAAFTEQASHDSSAASADHKGRTGAGRVQEGLH